MASYPKIWTDIFNDEWFVSLSGLERSLWLQLLILCKRDGDTGDKYVKSIAALATETGIDRRSCDKFLKDMAIVRRIKYTKSLKGSIHIEILNYHKHQRLRTPKDKPTVGKNVTKIDTIISANKINKINKINKVMVTTTDIVDKAKFIKAELGKAKQNSTPEVCKEYSKFYEQNKEKIKSLTGMIHYQELYPTAKSHSNLILKHIICGTIPAWLLANPDKAQESLRGRYGNNWLEFMRRWLQREIASVRAGRGVGTIYKEKPKVVELKRRKV